MLKYYYNVLLLIENLLNFLLIIIYLPVNLIKRDKFNKKSGSIFILGNGPSLKNDFDKILLKRSNAKSVMVVNSFAITNEYDLLKPSHYIIIDPGFFSPQPSSRVKQVRDETIDSILKKTTWNLQLFIPYSAHKSSLVKKLKRQHLINVVFFKNMPIIGGNLKINNLFYKYNLANPLFQNVLIAAIYLSIKMNFSNIFIWGADHSWHEDFILGNDNHVYTADKHFYNTKYSNGFMHCKSDGTPLTVHEEFFILARAFSIYHSLESFSKSVGCKIYNCSSKTWIDAFSRNNHLAN